jgi:hypothetical protein
VPLHHLSFSLASFLRFGENDSAGHLAVCSTALVSDELLEFVSGCSISVEWLTRMSVAHVSAGMARLEVSFAANLPKLFSIGSVLGAYRRPLISIGL